MSLTKNNLEAEKQEKNNQMDQDYWAEKGSREEVEKELRNDLLGTQQNLEAAEYGMRESARLYVEATNQHLRAGEALAKFLEAHADGYIGGVDFGPTLGALDGLTILK